MTEADWLACDEPAPMLKFLGDQATDRKLLLLIVIWSRLSYGKGGPVSPRARRRLDVQERCADAAANPAEVRQRWRRLGARAMVPRHLVASYLSPSNKVAADRAVLVRELFGNPFRPVTVAPGWLAWNGGLVPQLAEAIYQEKAFDRLPVLADALEEAGCDVPAVLAHLRGPGPHVRGCWAVDLLLGRE